MADDNHDASQMGITGRCLAMRVGKPSHSYHPSYHPEGFYAGPRSLGGHCCD